ncbi:MAG: hypothetical protein ACLRIP_09445, partial [Blautia massiliensis (ex Durand et al. 2017)]
KILKNWIHVFPKFAPFKGNNLPDTVEIDGADNITSISSRSSVESKLKDLSQKPEEKRAETSRPSGNRNSGCITAAG